MRVEELIKELEKLYPNTIDGITTEKELLIRKTEIDLIEHIKAIAKGQ